MEGMYKYMMVACAAIIVFTLLGSLFSDLMDLKKDDYEGARKAYKDFVKSAMGYAFFTLACILFFSKIVIHGYVPSESMVPTLNIGEHLAINGLSYVFGGEPERGDIVVFESKELDETLVKRCIGLPGDVITFREGAVYVNGVAIDEPYLPEGTSTFSLREFQVPEDHYFFLGDNRGGSYDSRYWRNSYIAKEDLIGKVFWHINLGNKQK